MKPHRIVLAVGRRGMGKSVLMRDLMQHLSDRVDFGLAMTPTAGRSLRSLRSALAALGARCARRSLRSALAALGARCARRSLHSARSAGVGCGHGGSTAWRT